MTVVTFDGSLLWVDLDLLEKATSTTHMHGPSKCQGIDYTVGSPHPHHRFFPPSFPS